MWLSTRGRVGVRLVDSEVHEEPLAARLAARVLHERDVARDVAGFIARWIDERVEELGARLGGRGGLGEPELAALLERVAIASGRPDVVRLAGALLRDGSRPPPVTHEADLAALLELYSAEQRPGILLECVDLDRGLASLRALVERLPSLPVAIVVEPAALADYLLAHRLPLAPEAPGDRSRAHVMLREGLVRLDERSAAIALLREQLAEMADAAPDDPAAEDRARSLAERLLYEALESHPDTRGRFELNARMSFTFGTQPAEIDLFARRDRLAVEIDGYYHFVDDDAYRRDRRKDALLQRHGLYVLRFLARDVGPRLSEIVDRIVDVLHRPQPEATS